MKVKVEQFEPGMIIHLGRGPVKITAHIRDKTLRIAGVKRICRGFLIGGSEVWMLTGADREYEVFEND